ncbi:MAG: hypothetical protein JRJ19_14925 [Deltaproteobacteria bacterium]|nr:hypothetical protein [Deltaproteobacteria bacterium]
MKKTLRLTKGRAKFLRTADKLHASTSQGATLAFADGNQIRLGSKTALGLTSHEDEFKLLFEQGEIEISAEDKHAKGFKMIFGESTLVTMTIGTGTFTRTSDGVRIRMTMGSAIVTQDGKQTEIKAGASFLMRMGKVVITRREALPATLKDLKRISRIRKSGSRKFVRPKGKTSQIKPGTDIQVRKGGMVALLNAGSNRVELRSGARALFKGFYHSKVETDGEINLETGQARVKLRREANADTSQLIVTPQVVIKAVARGLTAETNVTSTKSYTQLVVHSGEAVATVGENHILVRAGQTLTVSKSGKIVGPNYLLKPGIRLLEGVSARVFYDRSVPPVAFTWKNQEKDGQAIYELSKSPDFKKLLLSEPTRRPMFAYSRLGPGNYHWRVRRSGASSKAEYKKARLSFIRDPLLLGKRKAGTLTNVVRDTGVETRIYFQSKVPALTFTWATAEKANGYRIRVYSEDNLEKPLVTRASAKPRLVLPAGKLKEGTYYWYQAALGADGNELSQSKMNKLALLFDNSAYLLRIDSPSPGQRPRSGEVELRGVAAPGSSLTANGRRIGIDADGRFGEMLSGVAPGGLVVFQLKKPGLGAIYFVRRMGR